MSDEFYDNDIFGEEIANQITVNLPPGETLVVNGHRQTPLIITVSNRAERSPKRDARMLATSLSCSLDEQTLFHLSELLFAEYLAPLMQDTKSILGTLATSPPKKRVKKAPTDEH